MLRYASMGLVALLFAAAAAQAADKEVMGKLVAVDLKNKMLTVDTDDGKKVYMVNDETKFLGPRGGVSDKGLSDDRLEKGAELKLLVAGNNRTLREVHLPERKKN